MPPTKSARSRPAGSTPGAQAPRRKPNRKPGARKSAPKSPPAPPPEKSSKKLWVTIAILMIGALMALGVLVGFLDGYGQINRPQKADAIVVLGAGVGPGGKAGKGLERRVLHAVRLYRKGWAPRIIMTGGVGTYPPAEAEVAAQLAMQKGVPRAAIVLENKSTSTWENAANATTICKKHGWKSVLLVSDPFHLWRAQRNFQKCGMRAFTSPVAPEMWRAQPLRKIFWTAREAVLVARDWCLRRV
jgi:uncharacterized SAM-binding protein YcdF (DUF218 family)